MKQKNGGWIALFLAPACILFILIFAIPLGMVFVTSLFDYRLLPRTFSFVGFQNFIKLFYPGQPLLADLRQYSGLALYPLHFPCGSGHAAGLYPV